MDVGKSKLRGSDGIELGAQYEGASIGRDGLESENEQDDPFGIPGEGFGSEDEEPEAEEEEVEEAVEDFGTDGDNDDDDGGIDEEGVDAKAIASSASDSAEMEEEGLDDDLDDNEDDSDDMDELNSVEDADSDASSPPPDQNANMPANNNREALRKLMAEERKTVAASLSAAAKADIAKGKAIKQQRSTFDSLLNTRIKLQKALIATNSTAAVRDTSPPIETMLQRNVLQQAVQLKKLLSAYGSRFHPYVRASTPHPTSDRSPSP